VWHNGQSYVIVDDAYTTPGGYYPTIPAPVSPPVDLTPIFHHIDSLRHAIEGLAAAVTGVMETFSEDTKEWRAECDRRFDEIDQALRILIDE
jgi:hypothetical protein